ncbi:S6 family peptidase [Rahnella victoriana]|uniref:S6 family peptidase n=1 Tax=Rahnella victoriana TaxID=1510570 RepID=UPI00103E97D6|nr:S6 family peptidase [Rahnella victoriana]TBX35137.1 autotransporter outer membrane beta-barrel domain-containing protein [Rahnella victoriana]
MAWKPKLLSSLIALAIFDADAGIMREDVAVQDYRDFAENLGKYLPGEENIEVFKKDGTSAGILNFPMPDFGAVNSLGFATLISPSYVASVAHNTGYTSVDFGNHAKYRTTYKLISRNIHPAYETWDKDFHVPRLNKVVTEAAPVPMVDTQQVRNNPERYVYFARVGSGTQYQVDPVTRKPVYITGAYDWKSGGTMVNPTFEPSRLRWVNYGPPDTRAQPFSSAIQAGDSGSPLYVYDNLEKEWKIYGVSPWGGTGKTGYEYTSYTLDMQLNFLKGVIAENTDPDVTDIAADGDIHWAAADITQGENSWQWHGVNTELPSQATADELNASKDLRFAGDGGLIILDSAVNHGAAKLQFSNDYRVVSAEGADSTWVGGGIEVDAGKTVDWEVNGLDGDTLHKIGEGTLYVNAVGNNGGALNVGDGLVVLAQQANEAGEQKAFSKVTIVSGRPTVQIGGENQIAGSDIYFGYRGGNLDLNGYDMAFSSINHSDSGAAIINGNADQISTLTLNNSSNQTFVGHLGSQETASNLNVDYAPDSSAGVWELAGGADLNQLSVQNGIMRLAGRPTPHAGDVVFSDDWIDETYTINNVDVASRATLRVNEHATLDANVTLNERANLMLNSKSHLSGKVEFAADSVISVDQTDSKTTSTDGNNDVVIDATISGHGTLKKMAPGALYINSENTFTGDTHIYSGALILNGSLASTVTMEKNTVLAGNNTVADLILKDDVQLLPHWPAENESESDTFVAATQTVNGTLAAGSNNLLSLRTHFDPAFTQTDKLLINGDMVSSGPVTVQVTPSGAGFFTDTDNDGAADNQEGVSLIQVAGKATKDSFRLAGEYVARGAYAYNLYAFAPGRSSEEQRDVAGSGDQFWDYRLQNNMLTEGDNTVPVDNTPVPPEPTPDDEDDGGDDDTPVPEPKPDDGDDTPDEGDDTPVPPAPTPDDDSGKNARPAVTPQVPSYLSLPSALLSYNSRVSETFRNQVLAQDDKKLNIFFQYLNGEDNYHSSLGFMNYGYDYTQKEEGWLFGAKVMQLGNDTHSLGLSLGLSSANLDVTPDAADGNSKTQYTTWGLSSLLSYQYVSGLTVDVASDVAIYDGNVSTDLRGSEVADISATSFGGSVDVGYKIKAGNHEFTPLAGLGIQRLQVDDFTDIDNTTVHYDDITRPTARLGMRYRYDWDTTSTGKWAVTANTLFIKDLSDDAAVDIGDSYSNVSNSFRSGATGSSGMIDLGIINNPTPNVSLNTGVQYQHRIEDEGVDYWQAVAGVKVSF